jgi:spermidine/putrescine-binding protein
MEQHIRRQLDIWTEALWQPRLTRRDFLRRGAVLGVAPALLAQIGELYRRDVAAETGPTAPVLERIKKEGKKLFIYNWEDYVHPNTIPQFEKEFGVKVTYDTFPSNEQLLAKLQAGGAKYDVIFPASITASAILS